MGRLTVFMRPQAQILSRRIKEPRRVLAAQSSLTLREAESDPEFWGRLVESAVGAHLANAAASGDCEVYYWRDRSREVDFDRSPNPDPQGQEQGATGIAGDQTGIAVGLDFLRVLACWPWTHGLA